MKVYAKVPPRDLFFGMNKTEKAFALLLEHRKRSGEIADWFYERLTLKLGEDCRYTPDFLEVGIDGGLHLHETKGFMRDDALVKLKTCATIFPFPLTLWTLTRGAWTSRIITP